MCFDRNGMRRQANITSKKNTHVALLVIVVAYAPELVSSVVFEFLEKEVRLKTLFFYFLLIIRDYQLNSNGLETFFFFDDSNVRRIRIISLFLFIIIGWS